MNDRPAAIPAHWIRNAAGEWCHPSRVNRPIGELPAAVAEPRQLETLVTKAPRKKRGTGGMGRSLAPVARVCIIVQRHRLLDSADFTGGIKGIQDAIATSFGGSDADSRILWEYSQIRTNGQQGTIVKIEKL